MRERPYRSIDDPAALGTLERDQATGRRTADRSDKDRRRPRRRSSRRGLLAATAVIVLVLVGAAAAIALSGEDDAETADTRGASAAAGDPSSRDETGQGDGGEPASSTPEGTYDLDITVTSKEPCSRCLDGGLPGVGTTITRPLTIDCDGADCTARFAAPTDVVWPMASALTWDGSTLTGKTTARSGPPSPGCNLTGTTTTSLAVRADGTLTGDGSSVWSPLEATCPGTYVGNTNVTVTYEGRPV